jgi:ATP-dependent Clp protease ATP-binding subunit ClpC
MGTVDSISFNYKSARAKKARLGKYFSTPARFGLIAGTVLFVVLGALLLFDTQAMGWLLMGLASVPFMAYFWWRGELKKIPVQKKATSIDGILESSVLAQLGPNPSPQQLAVAVMTVHGGQFFAVRFGIGPSFLKDVTATAPEASDRATAEVWQAASVIRESLRKEELSAAILMVALLKTHPNIDTILAHFQLDEGDLIEGVAWYHHIQDLIAKQNQPRRTGGLARDWSFGYIPLLKRFGMNISEQIARSGHLSVELEAHTRVLDQMIKTFESNGRQNITLVGPAGSGKTTLVHSFAEQLLDGSSHLSSRLKYRQVISLDPSALISSAPGRGELEGLVNQLLIEAYRAKNVILCLDDAQLFFEEGVGSVDLSNVLLPVLEGGRLRMILTMDEQRWLQISQRNPALVNALNRVVVTPASEKETLAVLQDQLIVTEFQRSVTYMYQSLREAYRLSLRYIHELEMPGRALKLIQSAASYAENGLVTAHSVQQTIEQTMDVKVGVANGGDERERLLNMEQHIHERMINQVRAVNVVSDALRRARAGVRNQNRPIGTFLFLGPTGVGKTELSKALAEVYFSGEGRMIRIDMNEYSGVNDVARLIADGSDDPHSLTAQVMKRPFSVVLLDEIEKAHPNVLATLLQLLDEGILRDIRNKEVSFRDTIVIATSNAGSDRIRQYIEAGYQLEQFEKQFIDELINTQQFRPEFLNRFDEIVVFRPLSKDELLQVIDLILASVNKNLALQKVSVKVADDAKQKLVEAGYDPRLGARPMRRVVQRAVENLVAKRMLEGNVNPGEVIEITLNNVEEALRT